MNLTTLLEKKLNVEEKLRELVHDTTQKSECHKLMRVVSFSISVSPLHLIYFLIMYGQQKTF